MFSFGVAVAAFVLRFCSQEFKILGRSVHPVERSATMALQVVPERESERVLLWIPWVARSATDTVQIGRICCF